MTRNFSSTQATTQRAPAQPYALEAIGVQKTLPLGHDRVAILKDISLHVARGEFVAIVGPSGSGKSTLLGIIAGLDTPTGGTIRIGGIDITRMGESQLAAVRNQKIGMVFQTFNLIPTLTAVENVEAPLDVGRHRGDPTTRARQTLALVGLEHRLHHLPSQLSGGEQQRVAIARALVTDPAIVIMDEPTGNLDRANGANVLALIGELRDRVGATFVIATHDPAVAQAADRTIQIVDGRIA